MGVLCNGTKEEEACWIGLGRLAVLADFWNRYMQDGRCAIDTGHTGHFVGDETRWNTSGDSRTCNWCAKASQVLARWSETVERTEWRGVDGAAG